jgi:hypothetical protein
LKHELPERIADGAGYAQGRKWTKTFRMLLGKLLQRLLA